ncbi:MAG TPA: hypothetical protein VF552_14955 [Allosphingosinicella sp.]|jgi:hypothetical protein
MRYDGPGVANRAYHRADERGSIVAQSNSQAAVTAVNPLGARDAQYFLDLFNGSSRWNSQLGQHTVTMDTRLGDDGYSVMVGDPSAFGGGEAANSHTVWLQPPRGAGEDGFWIDHGLGHAFPIPHSDPAEPPNLMGGAESLRPYLVAAAARPTPLHVERLIALCRLR